MQNLKIQKIKAICCSLLLFPFLLVVNDFSIWLFSKFVYAISSMYASWSFLKFPFSIQCKTIPSFLGKSDIHFMGKCFFGKRNRIECYERYRKRNTGFKPSISIGNNVSFGDDCHVGCVNGISIGENTLIGSKVLIIDHAHGERFDFFSRENPIDYGLTSKGPIVIGKNCWIGEESVILAGVVLGDGCVVGAGSVVTHSFPSHSFIGGDPAHLI